MDIQAPVSDNLYITDLPVQFDEPTLRTVFGAYGVITQCKLLPSQPGQKSACLIRFQTCEEAQWIAENLNGNIPQGLIEPVKVRYADTPEAKAQKQAAMSGKGAGPFASADGGGACWASVAAGATPASGWGKSSGKGSISILTQGLINSGALPGGLSLSYDDNCLFVGNLPADTTDIDLYKIFAPFGAIPPKGVKAMLNDDGTCRGIGFVNFREMASCEMASQTLNGAVLPDGSLLQVKVKQPRRAAEEKGGKGQGKSKSKWGWGWNKLSSCSDDCLS